MQHEIDYSPSIADETKTTTCYMCACRCGIKVHLKDGAIRWIEGNKAHPVNKGVLCAKGSAGIMQHYSPARLTKPLLRVGPRGSGEFKEIEWDEALSTAVGWLGKVRHEDPRKLAFFTGRDQSQSLTGWWASQFGTPNHAAHGGFCSVNMAAGGIYTIGGSFWEFGEPDWEHTRYLLMFGIAEDHDSNPIKIGLGKLKGRPAGNKAKFVSVNPIRTGYSAIADEWIGIRPGTDGKFVLALVHELLLAGKIDLDYLARYSNAGWLVIEAPGGDQHGLFARDAEGRPLAFDRKRNTVVPATDPELEPALTGRRQLPDGRNVVPAFVLMAERYLDPQYSADNAAAETGIDAVTIRRIAAELAHAAFEQTVTLEVPWTDWTGKRHERMVGRPVAMHAMRGISAHSNGFHTCRAIHLLQLLLGAIDTPGSFRYKPPFPRPIPPAIRPAGRPEQVKPDTPMPGPPLGFPIGPEDLLIEADGSARRIDKAYSWDAPVAAHGLMHLVILNAVNGDPYPIDTLFMYMANMGWNSAMNSAGTIDLLTAKDAQGEYKIPRIIYADAFFSETVPYADLVLPDTTYLERWDCISLLDRPICDADGAADSIRQPVVKPNRDVRPFQDVLLEIGHRLKLPGLTNADGSAKYPGGYPDYLVHHERAPGIGPLAGWRGNGDSHGKGAPNSNQLEAYIANGCFWRDPLPPERKYFKHANRDYLEYAAKMGFIPKAEPIVMQLYSEPLRKFQLAAEGHGPIQPPDRHRARIVKYFDPLPIWYPPFEGSLIDETAFPLHALTQRPMAMYHSWGSQNAWLRQIHGANKLYMNRRTAGEMGLADGDWVWVESHHGRIKVQLKLMEGVNDRTVWTWNAIGKRSGAWNLAPDSREATQGFLLNHLIAELLPAREDGQRYANSDPVTGQAAWYDLRVRLTKAAEEPARSEPQFPTLVPPKGMAPAPEVVRYGAGFRRRG